MIEFRLDGKVGLVTGARRGIGRAMAEGLRANGAEVAAHQREGGAFGFDLSRPEAPRELIEAVLQRHGRLDYIVNNAALTPLVPKESGFDGVLFDRAVAVNLRAPLEIALVAAEAQCGLEAIVNIGSANVARGDASSMYFLASKSAIPALTKYLAKRLAPAVRVNALLPGLTDTEEIAERGAEFEPQRQEVLRRTPMQRMGAAWEVAETVLYLLAGNAFMTGAVVTLDGGWRL